MFAYKTTDDGPYPSLISRMSQGTDIAFIFALSLGFIILCQANDSHRTCQMETFQHRVENRIPSVLTESFCLNDGEFCGPHHKVNVLVDSRVYLFPNTAFRFQCGQLMNLLEVAYVKGDRIVHKRNLTIGAGCACIEKRGLRGSRRIGVENVPIYI